MAADPLAELTPADVAAFEECGLLVLRSFYDVAREIEPIRVAIHRLIGLIADDAGVAHRREPYSPDEFDAGYLELIAADRRLGGRLYDAIKQTPPFVRLVGSERHEAVLRTLRATDLPGVVAGGAGIRIDNPGEESFRAPWHQEYPFHFRSLDGCVFWSPLRSTTPESGGVDVCLGSHAEGLLPIWREAGGPRSGAYAVRLADEDAIVGRYEQVVPQLDPGDVAILDFRLVHRSAENRSSRPRWSMQSRWFNFLEGTGRAIGWASARAGEALEEVHPELVVDGPA